MKNKSSWIVASILAIILFGIIYYNNHQDIFYVKKAHKCFKNNNVACLQSNLEKAFALGFREKTEREMFLNSIITAPLDINAQEKLLKFKNLGIDDSSTLRAEYFIHDMRREINNKFPVNYIMQAVLNNKIVRWGQNLITYKIENIDKNLPEYYEEEIENAFLDWSKALGFELTFERVENNPNILIKFNEHNPADDEYKRYIVAYTTPNIVGNNLKNMDLIFYTKAPNDKFYTKNQVYNTALHEIAHALGVMGHSNNKDNIMYLTKDVSENFDEARAELTSADINTVKLLYKLMPDITNDFNEVNAKYLPFLVLGDSEDVTNAKIREAKLYIKRAPNLPNGYMDLAEAYVGINEYSKAAKYLDKALFVADNNTIREMIFYNLAVCNYYAENYILAEDFIQKALELKKADNSKFLLGRTYLQLGQYDKAEEIFKHLVEKSPKNIDFAISLINIYLKDKKYLKARKVLKNFVNQNPDERFNPRLDSYGFLRLWL